MKRFAVYGSPHSLPTYKVALMLRLSGEPFSFRYVSFQKGMHKTPAFLALSRWGQVPVPVDNGRIHVQSAAIVEHLADALGRFQGRDSAARQAVREWPYWDVDALFPPISGCYRVQLGERKLLPISVAPAIADHDRQRAEAALSVLDSHLARGNFLYADEPTTADIFCYGDVAFAGICAFDLNRWTNVADWTERVKALAGFKPPFELLAMEDAELSSVGLPARAIRRAVRVRVGVWRIVLAPRVTRMRGWASRQRTSTSSQKPKRSATCLIVGRGAS